MAEVVRETHAVFSATAFFRDLTEDKDMGLQLALLFYY